MNKALVCSATLTCILGMLSLTGSGHAQPYGLDAPQPVGPFLNGVFPPRTPQAPGSSQWEIVDALQVAVPNTLVIEPNPANDLIYVGSRGGVIVTIENDENSTNAPQPFMDLSDRVAVVWDGGFLGLAFHPEFGTPGSPNETTFYAYYSSYCPTAAQGSAYVVDFNNCNPGYPQNSTSGFFNTWLRLSRFQAYWDETAGAWKGDPASEKPLFNLRLYNGSHRGGGPVFANDGYLYVAIGDQFRYETAQDIVDNFEGGSVRLAVDVADNGDGTWSCPPGSHQPIRRMQDVTGNADEMTGNQYCIPDDNPWPGLAGENFAEYNSIGHRNPHRIALDPVTGLLWSGEVGQSTREEINVIIAGRNYQWPYMEGLANGVLSKPTTIIGQEQPPVIDFIRTEARTIIGGYVYRGTRFPELSGRYIAGDYSTNNIWAITLDMNSLTATKELLTTFPSGALGTFGQDKNGEIFMGDVFANIPLQRLNRIGQAVPDPPALLSQTGAFADTASFTVSPAAVPYDLAPFWSDDAYKQRWLFLPNDGTHDSAGEQIAFSADSNWGFPTGTVAMKHFELGVDENDPNVRTRLETRFLVMGDDGEVYGVTYRWRPDQSDADLLTVAEVADYMIQVAGGGTRQQTWLFPSRAECMQCHTDAAAGFLGLRTHQQNRDFTYPSTDRTDNQLRTWNSLGMFSPSLLEAEIPTYLSSPKLDDNTASLEARARSWLDSNCSNCHRPGTGNRAGFDARFTVPLESQGLIWGTVLDDLGLPEPYLIAPGDPASSAVPVRAAAAGGSNIKMPPLAKELVDAPAIALLDEWILRVSPDFPRSGLVYEYYEETGLSVLPDFDALTPVATGTVPGFDISVRQRNDDFAFRFRGYVDIPQAGNWTFYTSSDDGSQLFIDGALVVDNDGLHSNAEQSGTINLAAGLHEIVVTMFERGGQEVLTVSWEGPGQPKVFIPTGRVYQEPPTPFNNTPPVLATPGTQISNEGDPVFLASLGTDADGDLLHFEAHGLPAGLTINSLTGEISGTIASGQIGVSTVVASASDGPDVSVVTFDWEVRSANGAPSIVNPGNLLSTEGDVVSLFVDASDPDGDPLTASATGLPPDLSIDSGTGEISGTVANGAAGTYDVSVSVSDGAESANVNFQWTVDPAATPEILAEARYVSSVTNTAWTSVTLDNTYSSMVAVATPQYAQGSPPLVARMRNATGNRVEIRLARMDGDTSPVSAGVHLLVIEEGIYDATTDGITMEAVKYTSTVTAEDASWVGEPRAYANTYIAPVVLGQVMTANDSAPSSFWAHGSSRQNPPNATTLYTGKTVLEDPVTTRADEVVGYVVIEPGHGVLGGRHFEASLGIDTVLGFDDNPPFLYGINGLSSGEVALLSMAGMDGGNGGWPVVMGLDPFGTFVELAVDEDQLRDGERSHTSEQLATLVFEEAMAGGNQAPSLNQPEDQTAFVNTPFSLQLSAVDPEGDPLTYDAVGLPEGLGIDTTTGLISGAPALGTAGTYAIAVTVDDGTSINSASFMLFVAIPAVGVRSTQGVVTAVSSDAWTTIILPEVFSSMVVVATPVYTKSDVPAVVRIQHAMGDTFEMRMARMDGGTDPIAADVHYLVVEEGVYNVTEHGINLEAAKYESTVTDSDISWNGEARSYLNSYANPVVLGQVMSANDPSPSTFWCQGATRTEPPSATVLRTGKSVSEDPDRNRANETVGYIVFEAGSGTLEGTPYIAGLGADTILGMDEAATPVSYTLSGLSSASVAVASLAAIDGGNGGWAVLHGPVDPAGASLQLAIDEDQLRDFERAHTSEQVGYVVFEEAMAGGNQAPSLNQPEDQTAFVNTPFSLQLSAVDPEGDPLTYDAVGLPEGLGIDTTTGLISGAPALGTAGTYAIAVTVDDGTSINSASFMLFVAIPAVGVRSTQGVVTAVSSDAWTTIILPEVFSSMVVVATPVYTKSDVPAVVRIQHAMGDTFEMRMARMDGGTDPIAADVHYLVVEEGVYNVTEHGINLEAAKYESTVTDSDISWNGEARSYLNSYANPVVLGQVMSANDPSPSTFWCQGATRTEPPSATVLRTGKSVSEDPDRNRANETVGYIVFEAGSGTLEGTPYIAGLGADTILGMDEAATPVSYTLSGLSSASVAVASLAAIDGGNGGWAVLHGPVDPAGASLQLAIDEDQLRDFERAHISEQVGYVVFE